MELTPNLLHALTISWITLSFVGFYQSEPQYAYPPPPYSNNYYKCDPYKPPKCVWNTSLTFCVEDSEYPKNEIKAAISADLHKFRRQYADVPQQSADDLVEGVSQKQENSFDYSYYKGGNTFDITHWEGPEGYICPSDVQYVMPKRALNARGKWRVIVNDGYYYTQTARIEACLFPDSACRLLAPCYGSKCTQKYVYHRMLSWDPCDPYRGLFVDIFRLPSACSCHIPTGAKPTEYQMGEKKY